MASTTDNGTLGKPLSRDRLAMLIAVLTIVALTAAFGLARGTKFLMPGPLTSVHGAIEKCSSCHASSGEGKLSWLHGLVADPISDSKACLTCHKMPDTAFQAHGAKRDVLDQSNSRLIKLLAQTPVPRTAKMQSVAFPVHDNGGGNLACATCHQEHQGAAHKLNTLTTQQCRSCHVLKFDSFDSDHPKFDDYPFRRRTRIKYDHAGHFGKHYPELAQKDPRKRIPETCSSCHDSDADRRVMAVKSFDKTCAGCHRDQITGKERSSGPKGIAFLSIPGLDLQTLKSKNANVGEWPDASDAALTPFMKVMIARSEKGRAAIAALETVNLQDLSTANDAQIKAATTLAWEVKALFHALISGKASDVLGDFRLGGDAVLSAGLVSDLTASLPRDVVVSAQQEWLPNLATEMAKRKDAPDDKAEMKKNVKASEATPPAPAAKTTPSSGGTAPISAERAPRSSLAPAMKLGVLDAGAGPSNDGQRSDDRTRLAADEGGDAHDGRIPLPSGTPRSIEADRTKPTEPPPSKPKSSSDGAATQSGALDPAAASRAADGNKQPTADAAAPAAPPSDPSNQSDDLLSPTPEEVRAMKSGRRDAGASAQAGSASPVPAPAAANNDASSPAQAAADNPAESKQPGTAAAKPAVVVSIGSDIDPESWAEYGGWYRQDFAISYRPTGHKDKFIYAWLFLTGPQAPKGDRSPPAAVFDTLTGKDAQGSCTKCHSVDDIPGRGRLVNFSPLSVADKNGHFTRFVHEPHLGIMENRGCVACHALEKGKPYLKSYEQGQPREFAAEFSNVKQEVCKGCHNRTAVRQDCTQCHAYHVNGVTTSIIGTKIPAQ